MVGFCVVNCMCLPVLPKNQCCLCDQQTCATLLHFEQNLPSPKLEQMTSKFVFRDQTFFAFFFTSTVMDIVIGFLVFQDICELC